MRKFLGKLGGAIPGPLLHAATLLLLISPTICCAQNFIFICPPANDVPLGANFSIDTPYPAVPGQSYTVSIVGAYPIPLNQPPTPSCPDVAISAWKTLTETGYSALLQNPYQFVTLSNLTYNGSDLTTFQMSIAKDAPTGSFYLAFTGFAPPSDGVLIGSGGFWDYEPVPVYTPAPPPPPPPPCPTPSVKSVTPDVWFAGKSYNIDIEGKGFAAPAGASCSTPQVNINDASGDVIPFSSVNVVSDKKIVATAVAPQADTPTETVCVVAYRQIAMVVMAAASAAVSATPAPGTAGSPCTDPDSGNQGITVVILGAPKIDCNADGMQCNGKTISVVEDGSGNEPTAQPAVVGQQIKLKTKPDADKLAALGLAFSENKWKVDGTRIKDYAPTTASAKVKELTDDDLAKADITFYWVYPKDNNIPVTYKYCVDIPGADADGRCSLVAKAAFKVTGPTGGRMDVLAYYSLNIANLGPCVINGVSFPASVRLIYGSATKGTCAKMTGGLPGITFDTPTGYSNGADGYYMMVQLINSDVESGDHDESYTDVLDTDFPYGVFPSAINDSPNALLRPTYRNIERTMTATSFLMWQTPPPSIPVPLGYQRWTFSGSATCSNFCNSAVNWTAHTNTPTGKLGSFTKSDASQTAVDNIALQYGIPTWNGATNE